MQISPDSIVIARWGHLSLSATIVFTWLTMVLVVLVAALITRRLSVGPRVGNLQIALEIIVESICQQIRQVTGEPCEAYLPFVGTLFLFILTANLLAPVPGYEAPTGSLSTTIALALCVFVAVPLHGISRVGLIPYLRSYLKPTPLMLPFQIIGECSRTLALAMRLFGNIMSGNLITAILLSIVPLFVPVLMQMLGLVFGVIQAYVFAVLALVYISSAATIQSKDSSATEAYPHE